MSVSPLSLTVPIHEVIDPALWRERFAFGHQLGYELRFVQGVSTAVVEAAMRDLAGRLPEEVIGWHLRAALSELGARLGLSFERLVCKAEPVDSDLVLGRDYQQSVARLPLEREQLTGYCRIVVGKPLLSIERVRLYLNNELSLTVLPSSTTPTIRIVDPRNGVIHLVGGLGRTTLPFIGLGVGSSLPHQLQGTIFTGALPPHSIPDAWAVDYTTGPLTVQGIPDRIDAILALWVGLRAGRTLYAISGASQAGGIGSSSVSIDGVSQSATVSQSAMYGLNAPMETAFEEITKRIDWAYYRRRIRGIMVGGI